MYITFLNKRKTAVISGVTENSVLPKGRRKGGKK